MLRPPSHLAASDAQSQNVRFFWDDWNTEEVEEAPDEWLVQHMGLMSERAALAFAAGMSEWVLHRFEPLNEDPHPGQMLEAAWAAGADWRYQAETWEAVTRNQLWQGPVGGPLGATMAALDYEVELARTGGDLSVGARWISNIAQHVLPSAGRFCGWREAAAIRLTTLFPRAPEEPIGDPVPREALDMSHEFNISQSEQMMNQLLGSLQPKGHLFLASPAQLVRAGFNGTPYVFDLHRDRVDRRFW